MRFRVFHNASAVLLMVTVGVSPAVAYPPVEQRSAVSEGSQVLDPTDYGPRSYSSSGSGSSIYGGGASSNTYNSSSAPKPGPAVKPAAGSSQWEMVNQMQQLQDEVQQLRGMIEQQSFEIEKMRKQQREQYIDLDGRISRLQGGAASAPAAAVTPAVSSGAEAVAADAGGAVQSAGSMPAREQKTLYESAFDDVGAKNFSAAISKFESLLVSAPTGEYAPNCHYWLGELYMKSTPPNYAKSQSHLMSVLKQFPESPKVPDTLFKLGQLSMAKNDADKAKVFFNRVIKDFPDSQPAGLAKDYLKRL